MFRIPSLLSLLLAAASVTPAFGAPPGAVFPWETYEAADAVTNGERLASRTYGDIANESVRRACVRLNEPGQYLRWTARARANTLVIRHCIPDALKGGGATGTVELWIAGRLRQHLRLDSHHAWLYGEGENANSDDPAKGFAHRFFDDIRAFVQGPPIAAGDTVEIRLGRPADGAPEWTVIDLIDLENVAPPITIPPPDHLSAIDYGATPNDDTDDTEAIRSGLAAASKAGKALWLPPGLYLQSAPIRIDGVALRGAGPWHTLLRPVGSPVKERDWPGNAGFSLVGRGAQVRDLAIEGTLTGRSARKQHGFIGRPESFVIENVWVEHTDTGGWLAATDGVIRHSRFRNTYADGFNVNNGSRDVLFEHNHTRNTGDDGLASFANTGREGALGPNRNIVFRHNTVETPWWAHCIGVYGGEDIVVENNLVRGGIRSTGIMLSTDHKSWPGRGITIAGNRIEHSGGISWKLPWGTLFLWAQGADLTDVVLRDNTVKDSTYVPLQVRAGSGRLEAEITGNHLPPPTRSGPSILIGSGVRGLLNITGNTPNAKGFLRNESSSDKLQLVTTNP